MGRYTFTESKRSFIEFFRFFGWCRRDHKFHIRFESSCLKAPNDSVTNRRIVGVQYGIFGEVEKVELFWEPYLAGKSIRLFVRYNGKQDLKYLCAIAPDKSYYVRFRRLGATGGVNVIIANEMKRKVHDTWIRTGETNSFGMYLIPEILSRVHIPEPFILYASRFYS